MEEMAAATGRTREAAAYREMFENVQKAFNRTYQAADESLNVVSQTACVLALQFELVPESSRAVITKQLVKLIEANGHRMSTGFLGTKSI
jgi:alpha-L-rhamnosidase